MICSHCHIEGEGMVKNRERGTHIYYWCNKCNTERYKKYRQTESGRQATQRAVKKYELSHPKRRESWNLCQYISTKPCIVCGEKKVDRHHPDINKPLEVVFLCRLHHKQEHKNMVQ
jgi:hypothetical protein